MTDFSDNDEPDRSTRDRAAGLTIEGAPPDWGRPTWLGLLVAVVVAVALGSAVGYGVAASPTATPTPTASPTAIPTPRPTVAALETVSAFVVTPCGRMASVPIAQLPGSFASVSSFLPGQAALPAMLACDLFDARGRLVAIASLRQAPTAADELAVVVDEVFQGDEATETTVGGDPAFAIPCSRHWPFCHPTVAVLSAPYLVVVSLEPGAGDLDAASALAARLVELMLP